MMTLTGIMKGIKTKIPSTNRGFRPFNKALPLHPHNYPMTKITHWEIEGYIKNAAGIREYYFITKDLPTGRELSPRLVGLDGFISVRPTYQIQ